MFHTLLRVFHTHNKAVAFFKKANSIFHSLKYAFWPCGHGFLVCFFVLEKKNLAPFAGVRRLDCVEDRVLGCSKS